MFTECVNKIALSLNDDKTVQSINAIETHAYGKNEEIIHKKGQMKCINRIKFNTKND